MSYAAQQDLIDRFGEAELIQLTDRTNAGVIDAGVLAAKIADADAVIDSFLQGRYQLPLSAVPTVLVRVAADIIRYDLQGDRATENVVARYKDATTYLRGVSGGTVQLGTASTVAPVASTSGPEFKAPGRQFDSCSLDQMDADL